MAVQQVPNPIVHRVTMNPENETRKAKTRLDEIYEEKEERAAKRFSAAELDKMALESENEASRLRGEPPKHRQYGGDTMDDEEKKKAEDKQEQQRERITTQAVALINSGMEPQQVGQMLMGLTPTGMQPVPAQGMNMKDIKEIIDTKVSEAKESSELRSLISRLSDKIDDMAKNPQASKTEQTKPIDPIVFAQQQAETLKVYHSTLDEMGMIPHPGPVSDKGESIEVVKEKNRHAEQMEVIKTDRDYKDNITNIASTIPERVGRGIADRYTEGHDESGGGAKLRTIECGNCHTEIPVPPNSSQVTCPKCEAIYAQTETVEVK